MQCNAFLGQVLGQQSKRLWQTVDPVGEKFAVALIDRVVSAHAGYRQFAKSSPARQAAPCHGGGNSARPGNRGKKIPTDLTRALQNGLQTFNHMGCPWRTFRYRARNLSNWIRAPLLLGFNSSDLL